MRDFSTPGPPAESAGRNGSFRCISNTGGHLSFSSEEIEGSCDWCWRLYGHRWLDFYLGHIRRLRRSWVHHKLCSKAPFGITDLASIRNLSRSWKAHTIGPKREFASAVEGMWVALQAICTRVRFTCRLQLQAIFGITIVYASAIMAIKLSILLFYRRLFITARFKLVTSIIIGIVLIWWLAVVIVQLLQCRPIQAIWDFSITATCINGTWYYIGVAVPNITTDVIMLCLPVRMVWRLQTSRVHKFALTLTFLTGGL